MNQRHTVNWELFILEELIKIGEDVKKAIINRCKDLKSLFPINDSIHRDFK
jgi:hypothetical protein